MPSIGDGLGVDPDLVRAAEIAARQAAEPLRHPADLTCVFACADDPEQFAAALRRAKEVVGGRTVLGCTARGVIGGGQAVEEMSAVSVWAVWFPRATVRGFSLDVVREGSYGRVIGLPEALTIDRLAILIADPLTFPMIPFIDGVNAQHPGFPVVGGLVGGGDQPRLIARNDNIYDRGAVGVMISGSVGFSVAVSHAARPIGPALAVTKVDRDVIHELAGVPALEKLQEIFAALSPEDRELVMGGLLIGIALDEYAENHGHGDFLVRSVEGADAETGGLTVGDAVPLGRTVRFHVHDAAAAQADLAGTLSEMRGARSLRHVDGALLFSCISRGAWTFASADHDVLAVRTGLRTKGVAGCFASGEIGPVNGRNYVHSTTASMVAFGRPDRDVPLPYRRSRVRSGEVDG